MVGEISFYKNLQTHYISLENLLSDESLFKPVPEDWHVIVVDVVKSTQAVKNGQHQQVNLAATGSIISILNEFKEVRPPYFYGGDGATFIIPDSYLNRTIKVLENFRHHIKQSTSLILRVGSLSVKKIYQEKHTIKIAKQSINSQIVMPIALGTGLKFAENQIKSAFVEEPNNKELETINLDGMECRWREVEPPHNDEKILCLLANCPDDKLQATVYYSIIKKINLIFGDFNTHNPITPAQLKIDSSFTMIKEEMYFQIGKFNPLYFLKSWMMSLMKRSFTKLSSKGKNFLNEISENSYSIMIDGMLNNIIAGTQDQIDELIIFLDELEASGKIKYGIHITHGSVLSCYVEDMESNHIHFVDGTGGGYTTAAKMYKAKFGN